MENAINPKATSGTIEKFPMVSREIMFKNDGPAKRPMMRYPVTFGRWTILMILLDSNAKNSAIAMFR